MRSNNSICPVSFLSLHNQRIQGISQFYITFGTLPTVFKWRRCTLKQSCGIFNKNKTNLPICSRENPSIRSIVHLHADKVELVLAPQKERACPPTEGPPMITGCRMMKRPSQPCLTGFSRRTSISTLGFQDHSILFLKVKDATANIATSKTIMARTSTARLERSPLINRPLTASTA
jgi:hypothetical protein